MRNYQILKSLFNEEGRPVKSWQLRDEGFEFKFMTDQFRLDEGIDIFVCYEFGWYELEDNRVKIYRIPPLWVVGLTNVTNLKDRR
jgi:hypothetical protein